MTKIILKDSNKEKIEKVLEEIQKRTKERNINYKDIADSCKEAEEKLKLSKVALKDCEINVDIHAQDFPRAYIKRGVPESTQFTAKHNGKEWVITEIWRGKCGRSCNKEFEVRLTDKAKEYILDKVASLKYGV